MGFNIQKCRLLRARAHLSWTDAKCESDVWPEESTFTSVFGNHGHCVLDCGLKTKRTIHIVQVQKAESLMVWGVCYSVYGSYNFFILKGRYGLE